MSKLSICVEADGWQRFKLPIEIEYKVRCGVLRAGAEDGSGVVRPGSHEEETAPPQRPPLPQPHARPAAAGRRPAASLQHQEVSVTLETLLWLSKTSLWFTEPLVSQQLRLYISSVMLQIQDKRKIWINEWRNRRNADAPTQEHCRIKQLTSNNARWHVWKC